MQEQNIRESMSQEEARRVVEILRAIPTQEHRALLAFIRLTAQEAGHLPLTPEETEQERSLLLETLQSLGEKGHAPAFFKAWQLVAERVKANEATKTRAAAPVPVQTVKGKGKP